MKSNSPDEERGSPTESTVLEQPSDVPDYLKNAPLKKFHHITERRLIPVVLTSTAIVVGGLAFGLPIVLFLTVLVAIVGGLKLAITAFCAARMGFGQSSGLLSATDAFWLHDSHFNRYVAHCLFFVERGLDVTTTREILQSRVLEKTTETGKRAFARFTQKVVPASAGLCWVDDGDFDIERHVFEEARTVRNRHQLRELLAHLMSNPLATNRPLWEVRMVRDYGDAGDTVLIVRLHQSLSDGVTFVKILGNFLADRPQMLRLKPRAFGTTFPLNVFRALVIAPLTFLWWLAGRRDYNALSHGQPLSGKRVVGWSSPIRSASIDRIRQVTHCTVNDVLMAAARGAVRDYFRQHCGVVSPPDVTVNIPLDLRYEPTCMETIPELGNGYTIVNTRLPTQTEGAIPGLWDVHQVMEELKGSCDPVVMYGVLHYLMSLLPTKVCSLLVRALLRAASLSFCSLPGPERQVSLASRKLKAVTFWMNSHPDVPVAFCVFSYAGSFFVGVSADSDTISSPKILVKGFISHLDRMHSIVAKRKLPEQEKRKSSFSAERRREEILKPSIQEINDKLHAVQDELHELSRKLEVLRLSGNVEPPLHLLRRTEELKVEFVELITELRRRRSTNSGSVVVDVEDSYDPDGQLRRPVRRPSFGALSTLLSTSRPLLTQYAPNALYQVPSDPDFDVRSTPEQRRALLSRKSEERYARGVASWRENAF